jgi:phosphatidylinositol alpha-1,6-mannosyltransferase
MPMTIGELVRDSGGHKAAESDAGSGVGGIATSRTGQVLLLAPSRGLGGGIERYAQTVQSAFDGAGVACRRLDLATPGPRGHRALLVAAAAALAGTAAPTRVVIAHRSLLPVARVLGRIRPVGGISVICHGSDVWGARWAPRWLLESRLMHHPDVRLVAVSSFTAGALFPGGQATILPPGLSRTWFDELVNAADQAADRAGAAGDCLPAAALEVMTAFRLGEWRDKGSTARASSACSRT